MNRTHVLDRYNHRYEQEAPYLVLPERHLVVARALGSHGFNKKKKVKK